MTLRKQRPQENDKDFALRLEKAREAANESNRKYREANKEAVKESSRKYREANKEAERERNRKWREANKEAVRGRKRKYHEAETLKHAKGKRLRSNYSRAQRPVILTRLIITEAKRFCAEWGFTEEQAFDSDVLITAARSVRDNPFYPTVVPPEEFELYIRENEITKPTNPWYNTDYLHESAITSVGWGYKLRKRWESRT